MNSSLYPGACWVVIFVDTIAWRSQVQIANAMRHGAPTCELRPADDAGASCTRIASLGLQPGSQQCFEKLAGREVPTGPDSRAAVWCRLHQSLLLLRTKV